MTNLFEPGPDKGNMTEQNRAIRANPEQAMRDMLAAGRDPSEWGLSPEKYGFRVVTKEAPDGE